MLESLKLELNIFGSCRPCLKTTVTMRRTRGLTSGNFIPKNSSPDRYMDVLYERININESLLRSPYKKSKLLFKERVKRTASTEFEWQLVKRRRLGRGADRKIDATEEEFLREL